MDQIIRMLAKDAPIKAMAIQARDLVERARSIHHTLPVATAALGRTLMAASMMGDQLKEEDGSVTLRFSGGGPLGNILAVSDSGGNVRGYVTNPQVDLPIRERDGKLDVSGAIGTDGLLTVSRDLGLREPYVGSTALVSGEVAEDLAAYLTESDQLGSACGLGVLVDTDESVKAAGGFIVQLMPFAPEEVTAALEENIFLMDQLTTILAEDGPEAVIGQVLRGMEPHITERKGMEYRCYCSRERVLRAVTCLSEKDLQELRSDGREVEVRCQFCDAVYTFPPEEVASWTHRDEE